MASPGTPIIGQGQPIGVLPSEVASIFGAISLLPLQLDSAALVTAISGLALGWLPFRAAKSSKATLLTLSKVALPIWGVGITLWLIIAIDPYHPSTAIGPIAAQ